MRIDPTHADSTLAPALGIFEELVVPANGTSVPADGVVDLSMPAYLIYVDGARGQTTTSTGARPTFVVPCAANSFEVVDWSPSGAGGVEQTMTLDAEASALRVHLRDHDGVKLSDRGGLRANWSMTLRRRALG